MNIAVIDNSVVINIIVAESVSLAEEFTGMQCIDYTDGWNRNNGIDGGDFFPPLTTE